jgi:alpha-glucosidase
MKDVIPWWERGIVYEIYPRSFQDSDGDGVGDLPGIADRLDFLEWLGVDILWICPFFPSPMADFGYDITDYTGVDPLFGSLADFDRLLAEAHRRRMRVLIDFVPNHTSERHPWFLEARGSRTALRRDWYIWGDRAPRGGPPNNWLSAFGGSAWAWDEGSGQYYLHTYLKVQPYHNWRNPEGRLAMFAAARFWLERGVDGFRLDALWHLMKDERLRDNPPDPDYRPGGKPYRALRTLYCGDRPEIHPLLQELRRMVDEYPQRALLGELYLPIDRVVNYYGTPDSPEVHLPCNFDLLRSPWHPRAIAAAIDRTESALPPHAWPHWAIGNHDRPRLASRMGEKQARVAAMLLLTLRGTPTLYYGDELALPDVQVPPDLVQDPWEKNVPGRGLGRDPVRSPLPWDDSHQAGFTAGTPWLPLTPDWQTRNVAAQQRDPGSMLSLYRRLIALRREIPALNCGDYRPVPSGGYLLLFLREGGGRRLLMALNFSSDRAVFHSREKWRGTVLLSTSFDREGKEFRGALELRGDEGVIVELREEQVDISGRPEGRLDPSRGKS